MPQPDDFPALRRLPRQDGHVVSVSERTAIVWKSWDFYVGLAAGIGAGFIAGDVGVRKQGVTALLAEAAIGVTVVSVVLACLAIFTPTFTSTYRRVLEHVGGVREALAPFMLVAGIGAATGVVAVLAALAWAALGVTLQQVALAVATGFAVWGLAGMFSLVGLSIFHADQRAALMRGVEEAEVLRARRISEHRAETPRK